jgi:hypothetical protein
LRNWLSKAVDAGLHGVQIGRAGAAGLRLENFHRALQLLDGEVVPFEMAFHAADFFLQNGDVFLLRHLLFLHAVGGQATRQQGQRRHGRGQPERRL